MKTFPYTVSGFIPYGNREVIAGDELDFPITSEIAGTPATIRTVVLSVVDTIVDEVAGHTYDIQYDETLLGGNLLALDPCCDVGMPTAVTTDLILEEHIAAAPFIISTSFLSDSEVSPSVRVTQATVDIQPNQDTHLFNIPAGFILTNDLGLNDDDWDYLTEVTLVVRNEKKVNGEDSIWKGTAISTNDSTSTLAEQPLHISQDTHISGQMISGGLQILVRNDSTTHIQRASVVATITALRR